MVSPSYTDDDNRVVLRPLEGHEDCQSDYVNASYVDVSHCGTSNNCIIIVGILGIVMIFNMLTCIRVVLYKGIGESDMSMHAVYSHPPLHAGLRHTTCIPVYTRCVCTVVEPLS